MDNRRLLLLLVFSFSLVMLWDAWQKYNQPKRRRWLLPGSGSRKHPPGSRAVGKPARAAADGTRGGSFMYRKRAETVTIGPTSSSPRSPARAATSSASS
jgi:hypothetical protein